MPATRPCHRLAALALLASMPMALSGCVAAAIPPIIAGAAIGKRALPEREAGPRARSAATTPVRESGGVPVAPSANDIPPVEAAPRAEEPVAERSASGPIDAESFAREVALKLAARRGGQVEASAVIDRSAAGGFAPCGDKPAAVVIDLDDGQGVPRVPASASFVRAIDALRGMEAKPLFFTASRDSRRTDALLTDLQVSGLGSGSRWDELWIPGGYAGRTRADLFATAARHHCVMAIAGDRVADFAPGGDERALPSNRDAQMGRRWFLLSELGAG